MLRLGFRILWCLSTPTLLACGGNCPRPVTPAADRAVTEGTSGDTSPESFPLDSLDAEAPNLWGAFENEALGIQLSVSRDGDVRIAIGDSEPVVVRVEMLAEIAEEPPEEEEPPDEESIYDMQCHLLGSETLELVDVSTWEQSAGERLVVFRFEHEWALEADYGRCGGVIREERSGNASGYVLVDVAAALAVTIHTGGVSRDDSTPPMSGTSIERSCYDEVPEPPWTTEWNVVCTSVESSEIEFGSGGSERETNLELERITFQCIDDVGCEVQTMPLAEFDWRCEIAACHEGDSEGDLCPPSCYDGSEDIAEDATGELAPEDRGFHDIAGGRGWGERCYRHLQARRFSAARAACHRGLAVAEDDHVAGALRYNLGRVAEEQGEIDEARREYQRSLELRPNNRTVQRRLDGLRPSN